jgi:hypothetical protein
MRQEDGTKINRYPITRKSTQMPGLSEILYATFQSQGAAKSL